MTKSDPPKSRQDFEIGIICALQIEHDAVEVLLDEDYAYRGVYYGKAAGDQNAYTTGRIGRHHVVITYMPGIGKANAAAVASGLRSSFTRIRLALLTGVCGGAPKSNREEDILLGDVIISTAVIQTDFGRQYPHRNLIKDVKEGNLSPPNPEINSFIKKISGHSTLPRLRRRTALYMEDILRRASFQGFGYPGTEEDRLYRADYRHKHQGASLEICNVCAHCRTQEDEICIASLTASCAELGCEEEQLVDDPNHPRRTSEPTKPWIHFGPFALGDNVMKSVKHRDYIVREVRAIGFEMEGAGVWSVVPTIVVKAVCDYADSHKNKVWQGYAAIASATCVKAMLEEWSGIESFSDQQGGPILLGNVREAEELKDDLACMHSLSFETIDARQHNIRSAHQNTCDWLFDTPQFRKWHRRKGLESFNGVLWIKAKPGAGKSTLMKHALNYCRSLDSKRVIAAYFFNARGDVLEKTPLGMFRSLTYQLLDQTPNLLPTLMPQFFDKHKKHRGQITWYQGELREFLLKAASHDHFHPTTIFIDALDECDETEVREVISFFEELSIAAMKSGAYLNICLSSRHYPTINMEKKIELVIENQTQHDLDIAIYVKDKLRVRGDHLQKQLLRPRTDHLQNELIQKAKGVFMWAVLVVEMLNKEFDNGRITAMSEKLRELPSDLDKAFSILLEKDNSYKSQTILLLQWVLFARRPLCPVELYFAILAGTDAGNFTSLDRAGIPSTVITRFLTSTSKGLVEVCHSECQSTVQFIHESVNDFLLRSKRLQTIDSTLAPNISGTCHDRLITCCFSCIEMTATVPERRFLWEHPFLEYAATYVFEHFEEATLGGISPIPRFHDLQTKPAVLSSWKRFRKKYQQCGDFLKPEQMQAGAFEEGSSLLYVLSVAGGPTLVERFLVEPSAAINALGGLYGNALHAATLMGADRVVKVLLDASADVNAWGGKYGNALQAAVLKGKHAIVHMLLRSNADVNAQDANGGNALQIAVENGFANIVQTMLNAGANPNIKGGHYGNPLQAAAHLSPFRSLEIVRMLLDAGAEANARGGRYGTALRAAVGSTSYLQAAVQLHWKTGFSPFSQEELSQPILASTNTRECAKLLIYGGARVEECVIEAAQWHFDPRLMELLETEARRGPRSRKRTKLI